jgi:hypothetical protein
MCLPDDTDVKIDPRQIILPVEDYIDDIFITRKIIRDAISSGRLKARKLGSKVVLNHADFEEYLRNLPLVNEGQPP